MPFECHLITCENCGAGTVAQVSAHAVRADSIEPGWIVIDSFPPGDDGLYYACSEACFDEWKAQA